MQGFFLTIILLLPSTLDGQEALRNSFHESLNRQDIAAFEEAHFFEGIDEHYWIKIEKQQRAPKPTSLKTRSHQIRTDFSETPYRLDRLVLSLFELFSQFFNRPVEALLFALQFLKHLLVPLCLAAAGACLLQLSRWSNPLRRDILSGFGARSTRSLWALGLIAVGLCLVFSSWMLGLLAVFALASIYSWKNQKFRHLCFIAALLLSFEPLLVNTAASLNSTLAVEALKVGRNQLEYPGSALKSLHNYEKAIWSFWNGNEGRALEWAKKSTRLEGKMTLAKLKFTPARIENSLETLQSLASLQPSHDVLNYNLAQLHTRQQNLIAADESRSRIQEDFYVELSDRANRQRQLILFPYESAPLKRVASVFPQKLMETLSQYRSALFDFPIAFAFRLIVIWSIFFSIVWFRRKSSGLCRSLEEATEGRDEEISRLAELGGQKSEDADPFLRQKLAQYQRKAEGRRLDRIRLSSYFFPSAYFAFHGRTLVAAFLAFIPYALIWFSFPKLFREKVSATFLNASASNFSLSSFSMTLFLLGALIYVLLFWDTRKRASA